MSSDGKGDYLLELEGTELQNGWRVGRLMKPGAEGSGGHFSVCYEALNGTEKGFFKVLDFRRVLNAEDRMARIQELTTAFIFERTLLEYCRDLSKIVTAIQSGEIDRPEAPLSTIYYIIFELADGDVRRQMRVDSKLDFAWSFHALHDVAIGIQQLHRKSVYHQDLKPSNVLVYPDQSTKIADLGRSHCSKFPSPNEDWPIPGLPMYAPPEQLYMFHMENAERARMAADLYHLGSLILFMFGGMMMTPVLLSNLREEHQPSLITGSNIAWRGTFDGVLPYLIDAFEQCCHAFETHLSAELPADAASLIPRLMSLLRMLAHPDPRERMHPKAKRQAHGNPYDLQRQIAQLDLLAKQASHIRRRLNAAAA